MPVKLLYKKIFLIPAIILLVVALFLLIPKGQKKTLEFVTVKKGNITATVSASGILAGKNTANLKFKTAGKLAYINVKKGSSVQNGQMIAGLDTQDLSITLQQTQNNLRQQQTNFEKTIDDIHLFQYGNGGFPNVGTANETESQKLSRMTAEVTRDNAVDSIKAARRAFQDAVIIAPIDGIVTQADLLPGQSVGLTDTIAQIVDWSEVFLDADVDESDISKVHLGQPAQVTLNAYGDRNFYGVVQEITPETKTTSTGSTVVKARIALNNPGVDLISGLNGQTTITVDQAKNVLTIPQDALREDNTVFVQTADGIKTVPVKTGLTSDTDVQITSGLTAGQQVVKNPSTYNPNQGGNFFSRISRSLRVPGLGRR